MEFLENVYQSVLKGKLPETENITRKAIEAEIAQEKIIGQMNSAMEEVGVLFSKNEIFCTALHFF